MLIDISRMISKFLYRIYKISCLCSFLSSPGSSPFNPFLLFGFSITNSRRKCISYVFSQERVLISEKVVRAWLEKVVYKLNLRCLISWISYLSSKVEILSWFLLEFWNVNLERDLFDILKLFKHYWHGKLFFIFLIVLKIIKLLFSEIFDDLFSVIDMFKNLD